MGLDIEVWSGLTKFADDWDAAGAKLDGDMDTAMDEGSLINVYNIEGFGDRQDGMEDGIYRGRRETRFRAGSYSGYGAFRRALCALAHDFEPEEIWNNPEKHKDAAFYPLINFADNEGTIGSSTSTRLLKDFRDWEPQARRAWGETYLMDTYDRFLHAFNVASQDGGAVFFR